MGGVTGGLVSKYFEKSSRLDHLDHSLSNSNAAAGSIEVTLFEVLVRDKLF